MNFFICYFTYTDTNDEKSPWTSLHDISVRRHCKYSYKG